MSDSTIFSKVFSTSDNSLIGILESVLPIVCGIPESALTNIDPRYVVRIDASSSDALFAGKQKGSQFNWTAWAYLQEKIEINTTSHWKGITEDFSSLMPEWGLAEVALQDAGRTAVLAATTRRRWTGSSPIRITLKLRFEAIDDVYQEVLLPCLGLQGLTLPTDSGNFGLVPPGPNPYNVDLKDVPGINKFTDAAVGLKGSKISINIGKFLVFESVIVEDVKIVYENRMSAQGPVGATATVTIATFEMLTKNGLNKAYQNLGSPLTTVTASNPAQGITGNVGV